MRTRQSTPLPPPPPPCEELQSQSKYHKTISDSAAELLCPFTQTLPVDPVVADDGRLYERRAIEQWLKEHLTSPVTRQPMTARLLPAVQIRSLIERLVKSGALPDDESAEWHRERETFEKDASVRRRATEGSGEANALIAQWRLRGTHGEALAVQSSFSSPSDPRLLIPLWLQSAIAAASAPHERVCLDDERYASPRAGSELVSRLSCPGRLVDITARMRQTAVEWLVEVQGAFTLASHTLYIGVHFIDYYLAKGTDGPVDRNRLQLVAVACLRLAELTYEGASENSSAAAYADISPSSESLAH